MVDELPSSPQRGTGLAFVQHWDWVADKGLMPRNTALSIRTSVSKILQIDRDWESVDVRQVDVDALISRFRNLSELAPNSLATYESRFRSGLASYLTYLDNPTSYQPKVRRHAQREEKPGTKARKLPASRRTVPEEQPAVASHAATSPKLVVYPFPVRPDVFAELKLPADLTLDEASRLSSFLKAIAMADGDSGP
jgi:hypothetical protein